MLLAKLTWWIFKLHQWLFLGEVMAKSSRTPSSTIKQRLEAPQTLTWWQTMCMGRSKRTLTTRTRHIRSFVSTSTAKLQPVAVDHAVRCLQAITRTRLDQRATGVAWTSSTICFASTLALFPLVMDTEVLLEVREEELVKGARRVSRAVLIHLVTIIYKLWTIRWLSCTNFSKISKEKKSRKSNSWGS